MAFPLTQLRLASLALGKAAQPSPPKGGEGELSRYLSNSLAPEGERDAEAWGEALSRSWVRGDGMAQEQQA